MGLIWAVIAGLIVGLLAKAVLPGKQVIPLWLTVALGIVGAIVGNMIASAIGVRDTAGIDWIRHAFQIGVAAALIAVVAPMRARRTLAR
jgi:uncharacterized membrane protein YeaQ/YmgE (transglycosylase-associated protein family)